jgi:hypothetical protein
VQSVTSMTGGRRNNSVLRSADPGGMASLFPFGSLWRFIEEQALLFLLKEKGRRGGGAKGRLCFAKTFA